MTEQTDFLNKIKTLGEDARIYKEKCKQLQDTLVVEWKASKSTHEKMRILQEQNTRFKEKLKQKDGKYIKVEDIEWDRMNKDWLVIEKEKEKNLWEKDWEIYKRDVKHYKKEIKELKVKNEDSEKWCWTLE